MDAGRLLRPAIADLLSLLIDASNQRCVEAQQFVKRNWSFAKASNICGSIEF
jgi:hypothetical protein